MTRHYWGDALDIYRPELDLSCACAPVMAAGSRCTELATQEDGLCDFCREHHSQTP